MRRALASILFVATLLFGWTARAADAGAPPAPLARVTLSGALTPAGLRGEQSAQLLVTVQSDAPSAPGVLKVGQLADFEVTPAQTAVPSFQGRQSITFDVAAKNATLTECDRTLLVSMEQDGPVPVLNQTSIAFHFTPEVTRTSFFLFGVIGILVGFLCRVWLRVKPRIQPTATHAAPESKILAFLRRYYYVVDAIVSIALGIVTLFLVTRGARPADGVGCFALGIGLGLLTDVQLMERLGQKP